MAWHPLVLINNSRLLDRLQDPVKLGCSVCISCTWKSLVTNDTLCHSYPTQYEEDVGIAIWHESKGRSSTITFEILLL